MIINRFNCPITNIKCPIRETILNACHDINNILNNLIIVDLSNEESVEDVTSAGHRIYEEILKIRQTITTNSEILEEGEIISVREFINCWKDRTETHGWEKFWYTDHLKNSVLNKKIWVFPNKEDTIQENLISNWKKANVTKLHITPYDDTLNNTLVVEAIDNGCGITPAQLAKIKTGHTPENGEHGLGCQIIKTICSQTKRTVCWESLEYVGTKITFRHLYADDYP